MKSSLVMVCAAMCLVCGRPVSAQTTTGTPAPAAIPSTPALEQENTLADLQRDLTDIFNDPSTSNAFWGIIVQSLDNGQTIFRMNEAKSFVPASNFKLFTAAEALSLLSPDFRFTTQLITAGKQEGATLKGDVVIRGAGDPTLGSLSMFPDAEPSSVFEAWADSLQALGIKRIDGAIVGDDSYFTDELYPMGWAIEDAPYYYAMQTTGLAFSENQLSVTVTPGKAALGRTEFELNPATNYVAVDNRSVTKADSLIGRNGKRDTVLATGSTTVAITREIGTNSISIKGEIPQSASAAHEQLSIENPTLYAAAVFREVLEDRGISITGKTYTSETLKRKTPYLKARVLAQYSSPALSEIVRVMNKQSNNLYAEMLFRTVGKETEGEGSWRKGGEAMKKFLTSIGIAPDRVSVYDGSGLSRMDLVSPAQLVTLLRAMHQRKLFAVFYPSLPIMGVDGTLSKRLKDTRAQGNVHAKTGFLTGVRTISGYLTTKDNEMLAFSMMTNDYTVPTSVVNNLQDLALLRLVNFSRH